MISSLQLSNGLITNSAYDGILAKYEVLQAMMFGNPNLVKPEVADRKW